VEWAEFGKFVGQLLRWTQRKTLRQNMAMNVASQDGRSQITVDLYNDQDEFINNADLTGTVTVSGKASTPLSLEQTAPGRYKGSFAVDGTGEYFITVSGKDGRGEAIEPRTTAFAIPYSAEYIPRPQNLRLLRKLADLTGGHLLHLSDGPDTLAELFRVSGGGHRPPRSLWYVLILGALTLYFLDIATRKLPPAEQWLGRLGWRWPQGRRPGLRRDAAGGDVRMAADRGDGPSTESVSPGELYVARLRGRSARGESSRTSRR
jgi:hypothetical protein